jgi:hypothetical protein
MRTGDLGRATRSLGMDGSSSTEDSMTDADDLYLAIRNSLIEWWNVLNEAIPDYSDDAERQLLAVWRRDEVDACLRRMAHVKAAWTRRRKVQ